MEEESGKRGITRRSCVGKEGGSGVVFGWRCGGKGG